MPGAGGEGGAGLRKPDRTVWQSARMSVSGTAVTTYDDGFPKARPSLPPSPRRSGRRGGQRRTLVALTDDLGQPQARVSSEGWGPAISSGRAREPRTRVVDPTVRPAERAGGVGGAVGNP